MEGLVADAAKKNEGLQVVTTNYAGVLVHSNNPPPGKAGAPGGAPIVSAMCQGDWLLSDNYDRVCAAIDAIQKGGLPNSLGKSENYLRAMKRAGDSQAVFYLDFQALYPAIASAFDKGFASAGVPGDPDAILKAIGLDALRGLWYSASFLPKETRLTFGLNYTEDRGLVQLAAFGPGAAKLPDWMPAKFFGAASYRFDLRAAYATFESILAAASPEASKSLQDALADGNKQLGIDIKRDLIGSLGGDIQIGSAPPPEAKPDARPGAVQQDSLIAIALENPEALNRRPSRRSSFRRRRRRSGGGGETVHEAGLSRPGRFTPSRLPANPASTSTGRLHLCHRQPHPADRHGLPRDRSAQGGDPGDGRQGPEPLVLGPDRAENRARRPRQAMPIPGAPMVAVSDLRGWQLPGLLPACSASLPLHPVSGMNLVDGTAVPDLQRISPVTGAFPTAMG